MAFKAYDLESNLSLFAEFFPDIAKLVKQAEIPASWEVVPSKIAAYPVPIIEGKALHSKVDPIKEAKRKVSPIFERPYNRFFFLPADFLYTLNEIVSKISITKKMRFFFFFKDVAFLRFLLIWRDLRPFKVILAQSYFYFFDKLEIAPHQFGIPNVKGSFYLENHGLFPYDQEKIFSIKKDYQLQLKNYYASRATQFYFDKKWLQNALTHLKLHFQKERLFHLGELKNAFKTKIAVLAGAGPSLRATIDCLSKHRDKFVLLAADTSLKALLCKGLEPDFVVSLDASYYNALDFRKRAPKQTILLCDITTYCHIPRFCPGRMAFFYSDILEQDKSEQISFQVLAQMDLLPYVPGISSAGNIGHSLCGLAEFMGFKEIIAVGIDMASPFFDSHIYCGTHFDYFYAGSDKLHSIPTQDFSQLAPKLLETEQAPLGHEVYLEPNMRDDPKVYRRITTTPLFQFSPWGRKILRTHWLDKDDFEEKMRGELSISPGIEIKKTARISVDLRAFFHRLGHALLNFEKQIATFLTKLESKEIVDLGSLSREMEFLERRGNAFPFLQASTSFFALSAERREGDNPYLKAHVQYSELLKLIRLLLKRVLQKERI